MVIDIHIHVAGPPDHVEVSWDVRRPRYGLLTHIFMRSYGITPKDLDDSERIGYVGRKVISWIGGSGLDRAVLLAIDRAHDDGGRPIPGIPRYLIGNWAAANLVERETRLLFGASVHPYRADAVPELERLVARGACLVKWLPSAQRIDPENPKCIPFYEALAHFGLPLLSHTGIEHTVKGGDNLCNHPRKLMAALERGVTVIAAHCGKRMFLHETCWFPVWKRMALEYENFFGDLGAFLVPTRLGALREIVRTPALVSKVLYGSDFPMVPWIPGLSFHVGHSAARGLRQVKNPLDRPWITMQALGVQTEVFSRAEDVLRIPAEKQRFLGALRTQV